MRTYTELSQLYTFEDRFDYLRLVGNVGQATFGFDRYINQKFYRSKEWREIRSYVIVRDHGCDLGIEGRDLYMNILIHHMNPIDVTEISVGDPSLTDPEFLITTTHSTHNAIHYGDITLLPKPFEERRPNDTKLW